MWFRVSIILLVPVCAFILEAQKRRWKTRCILNIHAFWDHPHKNGDDGRNIQYACLVRFLNVQKPDEKPGIFNVPAFGNLQTHKKCSRRWKRRWKTNYIQYICLLRVKRPKTRWTQVYLCWDPLKAQKRRWEPNYIQHTSLLRPLTAVGDHLDAQKQRWKPR